MNVVWFKRDLRLHDHAALVQAAADRPVLLLYILEPSLWRQPDMSARHYRFLTQCIEELRRAAQKLNQHFVIRVGEAIDVLAQIQQKQPIHGLWSHQETGNDHTYARDRDVRAWCQAQAIPWHEPMQHGVIRRLRDRNGWAARWQRQMQQPVFPVPQNIISINETSDPWPSASDLALAFDGDGTQWQIGGRSQAIELLKSFLFARGENYSRGMSSPITAFEQCSRLSAHLAFGTVSIREVFQATQRRAHAIKALPAAERGQWLRALRSFSGRLRWHCHFIQKLEDEPRLEFENLHPAYDGLREQTFNTAYFEAWKAGKTGYPMVDACMRALHATGWLNFRMRAMVMSFASYHLWLHWRPPALHLAQLFTDYEPGIHYSQVQMQSGTTGINAIRIYNPIKQSIDQDPDGTFIRRWVPELAHLDEKLIHTPWLAPNPPPDYPAPIVDEARSRKAAAEKIFQLRKTNPHHKQWAQRIVHKHGSRKSGLNKTAECKTPKKKQQGQLPLF
ncbi:FAD-binding domain-containing protein [Halothiobacillus sp.]|uniref:FAD-binding domain-containing protein n=1 Tax=Halothiobacillus sp. TaxID=1891311 RepID=UPI002608C3F6|nr:FAD-binding domain-containing protein [Halothiobacillus sp.]